MVTQLRVAGIVKESIVDGPGIRYVVFAQGCKHNCLGCHNPETHSFDGGNLVEIDTIYKEIRRNPLLEGVTFSGGEPFEQAAGFVELARKLRENNLSIMIYTGYTYEQIISNSGVNPAWGTLLELSDILVDGSFIEAKKDYRLKFKGSDNQRIIDLRMTRLDGNVILENM